MPLRGEAAINTGVKIGLLVDAGDKSCSKTSPLAIVTYNMVYSPIKKQHTAPQPEAETPVKTVDHHPRTNKSTLTYMPCGAGLS